MPKDQAIVAFPESQKMAIAFIRNLKPGNYWFEVRRCKDQRTLSQNAFFHGVWLPRMTPKMSDLCGESVDIYDVKEFLKDRFLRECVIDRNTGEIVGHRTRGTHELDTEEFSEFLNKVFVFAREYLDITLPDARKFREEEIPL